MIKDSFKLHGTKQFEVKQKVVFDKDTKEESYTVETYFFLPSSLQINSNTYDKKDFQRNLKSYLRIRAPQEKLARIAGEDGLFGALWQKLTARAELQDSLADGQASREACSEVEGSMKLYALAYKKALGKTVQAVLQPARVEPKQVVAMAKNIVRTLDAYRGLETYALRMCKTCQSETYWYCDEYMSIVTADYLKKLVSTGRIANKDVLVRIWNDETEYLRKKYPTPQSRTESDQSMLLMRWSALKKHVSSFLFLDVKYRQGAPLLVHSIYGFAAAVSMIFATVVAFTWQDKYGSLSMNLFIALVIAYIFKDRMKEIFRGWMWQLFRRWIPDRRLIIYKNGAKPVGVCRESFDFIPLNRLRKEIRELYEQNNEMRLVNDRFSDTVFLHKKLITLRDVTKLSVVPNSQKFALLDIVRLNLSRLKSRDS